VRLYSKRKLCELKRMAIFRDARAGLMRLLARSDRERGQSLPEYGLILAVVLVATIAVLGMAGSTVSGQLGSLTTAFGGEGERSADGVSVPPPAWIAIGVLAIGAVGLYLLKMRRG
jgi:Flp pilus assembly pilin Flp